MRPLHLRLQAGPLDHQAMEGLVAPLRAAGHLVTTSPEDPVPAGVAVEPEFLIVAARDAVSPGSLAAAEARHIALVLRQAGGNRRRAALVLGIARSTLLAKIRRYGLS